MQPGLKRTVRYMHRRDFLKFSAISIPFFVGCGYRKIDPYHILIRGDVIESLENEKEIVSRARLNWTDDGRVRVLHVSGTPYEMGYQQGVILRAEVQDNIEYMMNEARNKFHFEEFFAEVYERTRPFIPQDYIDEMHGLAHGSRLPINLIHYFHILPSIAEWGGKKRVKTYMKQMMNGELGTSCSNIGAKGLQTQDGRLITVRILDWGLHRISKLHEYPLITVAKPNKGIPYANIGWVGFLGAVSGMNAEGITLGEMGYGDPPNETLRGRPMPFLLRDILRYASNLTDVQKILKESPGENSYGFLMTDGKTGDAELYLKDRDRFVSYGPGDDARDNTTTIPPIKDTVYGGHDVQKLSSLLNQYRGKLTPELLMTSIIPLVAMKSNFQNVVYDPKNLTFWVSNAANVNSRAAEEPYTHFDLAKALKEF